MGTQEDLLLPVREHRTILARIQANDFDGATVALIKHLDRVKSEALEMLATTS